MGASLVRRQQTERFVLHGQHAEVSFVEGQDLAQLATFGETHDRRVSEAVTGSP